VIRDWLRNHAGRLGRPADLAPIVSLLASPLSGYITGASFRVDGGSTAAIH
jgi:3-oxoacyl-[acyl-carrier protein] reductase